MHWTWKASLDYGKLETYEQTQVQYITVTVGTKVI
jgi:hypothetical protein